MKKIFGSWALVLFVFLGKAQVNICGHEFVISQHSIDAETRVRWAEVLRIERDRSTTDNLSFREEIIIPVVFHVVWIRPEENISEKILVQQIQVLNEDFNALNPNIAHIPDDFKHLVGNANMRFCLASEDSAGRPTNGVVRVKTGIPHVGSPFVDYVFFSARGGSDAWDTDKYLNIWIASTGSIATGYASLPWFVAKEKRGVVIDPANFIDFNLDSPIVWNKRVLVHEIGHYLGLDHLWGYDMYGRPTCIHDDGIDDTPQQRIPHRGCPEYPQITCESTDLTMNFMNYTSDRCMYMFTNGQVTRMHQMLDLFLPELGRSGIPCIDQNVGKEIERLSLHIWPNPAKSKFRIQINFSGNVAETGDVEIWNIYGRQIFKRYHILRNQMEVELPYLPPGTYILKIGLSVQKFIVVE